MSAHYMNPAGRLFEFMSWTWASQDNLNLASTWSNYLGVELNNDLAGFYSAMSEVLHLPDEVRRLVEELERPVLPKAQLLRGLEQSVAVLNLLPGATSHQIAQAKQRFHQGTLSDLETCSGILNSVATGNVAGTDVDEPLDAIRNLADEIVQRVVELELSPAVERVLWEQATAIIRSVDLFKISGPEGVAREYWTMVGSLVTNPVIVAEAKHDDTLWQRIIEIGKNVVLLGAVLAVPVNLAIEANTTYAALEPLLTRIASGQ